MKYTIRVQEKAWMDETMILSWSLQLLGKSHYMFLIHKYELLFLSIFTLLHSITSRVKQQFREINTIHVVIPGGCTSKIQPLGCLSEQTPSKPCVCQYWSEYIMQNGMHQSKIKPPTREIVAYWISKGYKKTVTW